MVKRATLHNDAEIRRKDIRIGDTVLIRKAGEVIPEVVKVITDSRSKYLIEYKMPTTCPTCGEKISRPKGEVIFRCTNPACPDQIKGRIRHFASRDAMDIEGLGPAIIDQLVEKGLIKDISGLYFIKREDLISLERLGEKSSNNLLKAIEESKKRSLANLIYGLEIRYVGVHTSEVISKHYPNFEKFKRASLEELVKIKEIGPKIAESILFFFKQKENLKILEKLITAGLNLGENKEGKMVEKEENQILTGKQFVLTGTLKEFSRDQAKMIIKHLGGRITGSVSSKTDFVVLGENPGSKYEDAKKLGIRVINEEEFKKIIYNK